MFAFKSSLFQCNPVVSRNQEKDPNLFDHFNRSCMVNFHIFFLLLFINVQYISCGKYAIYFSAQPLFSAQTYYVYEFPCTHIPQSPNFMFSQGLLINLLLSFEKKRIFSPSAQFHVCSTTALSENHLLY